ncbi:MAG TPA: ABC transporter permease, partial [Candidatus Acidoferrum sp.]|nr:ABC transporter permease [Candidatus Acidoferrum sp.]
MLRRRPRLDQRNRRAIPVPVAVLAAVAVAFFVLPLVGLLTRASWGSLWQDLTSQTSIEALRLSLECSLWSTVLSLALGVPLAWVLARSNMRGRALLRALVLLPMVLPPVVGGVALLFAFGRTNGLIGPWLYHAFGIQLTFTPAGVVLAETFVAMPFLVITVEGGLRAIDTRFEEAATTLGAGPFTTFRRVTVPLLKPSLFAGTALAWARALGEFGATITFAGDISGRTQTTPLAVYLLLESNPSAAIALSLVLL